jgi:hypothetical protein
MRQVPFLPSIAGLALAVLCAAATAHAQPTRDAATEPPAETHRYGSLILAADAVSVGALVLGGVLEGDDGRDTGASTGFMAVGLVGASFGAPVVHALRGNWRGAGASLLLRAAIPAVTARLAFATADCDAFCSLDTAVLGYLVGLGIASALDAGLVARERRPVQPPAWSPVVSLHPGGGQLGLAASF